MEGDFVGGEGREGRLFAEFLFFDEAFAFGAEGGEEVGGGAVGGVLGDKFAPDGGLEEGFAEGGKLCAGLEGGVVGHGARLRVGRARRRHQRVGGSRGRRRGRCGGWIARR